MEPNSHSTDSGKIARVCSDLLIHTVFILKFIQTIHIFVQTLLPENTNPLTGEPFGNDFLYTGILDLEGKLLI